MIKLKTFTLFLILIAFSNAQTIAFKKAEIKINTISKSAIYFIFNYDTKLDGSKIGRALKNNQNTFHLVDFESGEKLFAGTYRNMAFFDSAFTFEVVIKNQKILDDVFKQQKPVYIAVQQGFMVYNKENTDSLFVTQEFVKRQSLALSSFSERQIELLGGALDSNYVATRSNVDFARSINENDSTHFEYSVRFNLGGKLVSVFDIPFYFKAKGRVSTEKNNPLNQLETYIVYGLNQHISFDGGVISTQTFDAYAYRLNVNFETLLPNFINLTFANNRLRLKPYLNLALALHKNEQENPLFENKDPQFLVAANFYYPVPIGKKYTFIYQADATWCDSFIKQKVLFNYQAALVYDTPLEDLKVLLKAESGKKLFYNKKDTKLLLGLLLDITNM